MANALPLAEIYYPTCVSGGIRRRLYTSEWHSIQAGDHPAKLTSGKSKTLDGAEQLEKSSRLVVLGGPGAGKTTFLKFIALAYLDKAVFQSTKLKGSRLPFFVALPDLAKNDASLLDFLSSPLVAREGAYAYSFIERAVKKGLCTILLDSLDEVPENGRKGVIDKVAEFCRLYPQNKIVISCRAADYKEVLPNFDEVELVRLSKNAVEKIVRSWFKDDRQMAERLISVIKSDSSISELTETPLLLSLLCIQFKHDLALPRRKVEVYKRCVEALLRDWDTTRGFRRTSSYEALSDMHKERLFEHVAGGVSSPTLVYAFSDEKLFSVSAEYLERLGIDVSEVSQVISEVERHHGILEKHSQEAYCFSHASIQDYFIAKNAINSRNDYELVKDHLEDESWSSVIEFVCGIHADPENIFKLMTTRAALKDLKNYPAIERRAKLLYLMYRCLSVGPTMRKDSVQKANKHIVDSLQGFVRRMAETGVYPMCAIGTDGVRHPYYYKGNRRPSLHSALLPYRKLTNEILVRPAPGFFDVALESCKELLDVGRLDVTDIAVILNTIIPLSRANPLNARFILDKTREQISPEISWLTMLVDESRNFIKV